MRIKPCKCGVTPWVVRRETLLGGNKIAVHGGTVTVGGNWKEFYEFYCPGPKCKKPKWVEIGTYMHADKERS